MCFVFISEQTVTCATYSINWLVFITEMKCLLHGTDWVFKNESSLDFVCNGLTSTLLTSLSVWLTIGSLRSSVNVYIKRHSIYSHYLPSFHRCQFLLPVHISALILHSSAQFIASQKIYIESNLKHRVIQGEMLNILGGYSIGHLQKKIYRK